MLIGDLVTLDPHVDERSVVQIDFFAEQERNLALVKGFIVTRHAPEGKSSCADLLWRIYQSARTDKLENIFCIIANYGHGKSHFGLILANYFGKPADSEEFTTIMDKLEHAGEDPVRIRSLRDLRQERAPYLVVRLRGDDPRPLHQQFLLATKRALQEQGKADTLPLWYDSAAQWLDDLEGEQREKAEQWLERQNTDLAQLSDLLKRYDPSSERLVTELCRHLYGRLLHFEGDFTADELLKDVVQRYCVQEQRFGGVLVLFDEFSLFMRNYARGNPHLGSLQRLLEAVDADRQHVLFVAFAQEDPDGVIREIGAESLRNNLERELQRLPKQNKFLLYSRMEQVIDSYLSQDDEVWEKLRRQHPDFDDDLWDAASLTLECFDRVYSRQIGWSPEQFDEAVTKGCFPLHPLTTAILCNASLGGSFFQSDTPRTVLGFVLHTVRQMLDDLIQKGGRPNWVYPVALVDYFETLLADSTFQRYKDARQQVEGTPTPEQDAVLKALLLIEVAELPRLSSSFARLVAHITGFPEEVVKKTLKDLYDKRVIDGDRGVYRLWSGGTNRARLVTLREQFRQMRVAADDESTLTVVRRINAQLQANKVDVVVEWGGLDDWQASCYVLTRDQLRPDDLRKLAPRVAVGQRDWVVTRGRIVYLLALSEDDVRWFRETAQRVMDEAFPDVETAPAMLLVLPDLDGSELVRLYRWEEHLESGLSGDDRRNIGDEVIKRELTDVRNERERLFKDLFPLEDLLPSQRLVVPLPCRVLLTQSGVAERTVKGAMGIVYTRCAYRFAPPFFTQYHHGTSRLRSAVTQICIKLAQNRLNELVGTFAQNNPGTDCVSRYLQGEWHIVNSDYRVIEPPESSKVARAWKFLEETFVHPGKSVSLKSVILPLLNAPYGYHFHQLALLLCAWYGYRRHELRVTLEGRVTTLDKVWQEAGIDRSERFLRRLAEDAVIELVDMEEQRRKDLEVARQAMSAQASFSQQQAEQVIRDLQQAIQQRSYPEEIIQQLQEAQKVLQDDLSKAQQYDKEAQRLLKVVGKHSVSELAEAYLQVSHLPPTGRVRPEQPEIREVANRILGAFRQRIGEICNLAERTEQLEQVSQYLGQLQKSALPAANRVRDQVIIDRIQRTIDLLKQKYDRLQAEEKDKELIGELRGLLVDQRSSLVRLRAMKRRIEQLHPASEKGQQEHQRKLQEVEEAISERLQRLQQWEDQLNRYKDDLTSLRQLNIAITAGRVLYEATEELAQVSALQERCQEAIERLELNDNVATVLDRIQRISDRHELQRIRSAIDRRLEELSANE